jgi:hypothetical protein
VDDRQSVVDQFNSYGVGRVFLLSTRAGGAGLNLVGANHLVLYDRCGAAGGFGRLLFVGLMGWNVEPCITSE